jgi:hypothetical protein
MLFLRVEFWRSPSNRKRKVRRDCFDISRCLQMEGAGGSAIGRFDGVLVWEMAACGMGELEPWLPVGWSDEILRGEFSQISQPCYRLYMKFKPRLTGSDIYFKLTDVIFSRSSSLWHPSTAMKPGYSSSPLGLACRITSDLACVA